jgi:hypothetical protein
MPAIAEAAAQARLLARRSANAAAVVIGASFHPFRTVRDGATVVKGLITPPSEPVPPAPTDVTTAPEQSTTTPDGQQTATRPQQAVTTAPPVPDTAPATEPALAPEVDDRPVEARGPAPHIPPSIAGEVERDYGDELPGIKPGNAEDLEAEDLGADALSEEEG